MMEMQHRLHGKTQEREYRWVCSSCKAQGEWVKVGEALVSGIGHLTKAHPNPPTVDGKG